MLCEGEVAHLAFLEKTPFLLVGDLGSFFVVSALHAVGPLVCRHGVWLWCGFSGVC